MGHGFHGELLVITIGYYEKRGILMAPPVPIIFAKSTDKLPQSCFPIVGSRNVAILLGTCPVLGGCGLNVEDLTSWGSMNPIVCSFSGWMSSFCGGKKHLFWRSIARELPRFRWSIWSPKSEDPGRNVDRSESNQRIGKSPKSLMESQKKIVKMDENSGRWSKMIEGHPGLLKILETQHGECLGFQWWPVGIVGVRMFPCRGVEGADLECKTLQKCVDQRRW